jgi:chromosome segregation ATPase
MKRRLAIQRLATLALCLAALVATGCSSSGRASESEQAVDSMKGLEAKLDQAKAEVNQSMAALDGLSAGGDLQKSYSTYNKEVAQLEAAGKSAAARGQSMRQKREAYIAKWDAEVQQMQNPDVKASMQQRKQAILDNYDKLKASAEEVKGAYGPYLKDLKEIQKALSLDLSTAGVQSLQPSIAKAKQNGQVLNQKIDAFSAQLKDVMAGTSPPAPPK